MDNFNNPFDLSSSPNATSFYHGCIFAFDKPKCVFKNLELEEAKAKVKDLNTSFMVIKTTQPMDDILFVINQGDPNILGPWFDENSIFNITSNSKIVKDVTSEFVD